MKEFNNDLINKIIDDIFKGKNWRIKILSLIEEEFFSFKKRYISFLKSSYRKCSDWQLSFLKDNNFSPNDMILFGGLNKKTIFNIYGSANKETVKKAISEFYSSLINIPFFDEKIVIDGIELNENESKIYEVVLTNAKRNISGGTYSCIGKQVEKAFCKKLCDIIGIKKYEERNISSTREIDFVIFNKEDKKINIEMKLSGKGNPESADAAFSRDTNILIIDFLSPLMKNELLKKGICFVELSNNNIINDFMNVCRKLNIV